MEEAPLAEIPLRVFQEEQKYRERFQNQQIAVIGAGGLGQEVIKALYQKGHRKIIATRRREEELRKLRQTYSEIEVTSDNCRAVQQSEVVVLTVKPYALEEVATELRSELSSQLVISLAAGKKLSQLEEWLGYSRVSRVMTGLFVAEEIAFYTLGSGCLEEDSHWLKYLFGEDALKVEEPLLDVRTYLACDLGIMVQEEEAKIKRLAQEGISKEHLRLAYGKMLLALGKRFTEGTSGEELFSQVTGNSEKAFTYKLHCWLKEQGHYELLESSIEKTLNALRGK